jgi:hypothetical protein
MDSLSGPVCGALPTVNPLGLRGEDAIRMLRIPIPASHRAPITVRLRSIRTCVVQKAVDGCAN